MATQVVEPGGSATLPRRALQITADSTGAPVRVELVAADRSLHPLTQLAPGLFVVEGLYQEVRMIGYCDSGETGFADDTTISVAIEIDGMQSDFDPPRVILAPIEAGGHRRIDMATLRTRGEDRIEVAVPPPDAVLSPLAHAARSAARVAMNAERLDPVTDLEIQLDVDPTVSMVPRLDDGSLTAAVDVVVGVAHAVECRRILVRLLGVRPVSISSEPPVDIAQRVRSHLLELGPGVGLTPVDRIEGDEKHVALIITDLIRPRRDAVGYTRRDLILDRAATEVVARDAVSIVVPPAAMAALPEISTADTLDRLVRVLLTDLTVPVSGAVA